MPLLARAIEVCRAKPTRLVLSDGEDKRAVTAAMRLAREGLAAPVLLGRPAVVSTLMREELCRSNDLPAPIQVIDPLSIDVVYQNALEYLAICRAKGKEISEEKAVRAMLCPLAAGAMMLRRGQVEIGVAGNVSSTTDTLRAGLAVLGTAPGIKTVSGFFFMVSPPDASGERKILLFADAGVIPEPTDAQLVDIAISSAGQYRAMTGDTPRVAFLSFSSHGSAKHPAAERMRKAAEATRAKDPTLIVDGELQFDAAMVPDVAARKTPQSPVRGMANVFIFPSLEAGNIAYKIAQRLGGYTALGPLLQGLNGGWHDLSRGCDADDIYQVALIGAALRKGG